MAVDLNYRMPDVKVSYVAPGATEPSLTALVTIKDHQPPQG